LSQLRVSAIGQQDFYLNVLSFDSPIVGEMNSAQTRGQIQYFPIKAFQPNLTASVIFPSEAQWQSWQAWVRDNMVNTQNSNFTGNPGCTLNWPERNINNWIAVIPTAKAGGMRRNYAPHTSIDFQLITSLVSKLGVFASFGTSWQGLFGAGSNLDSVLQLPENIGSIFGSTTPGNGNAIATANSTGAPLSSLIPGLG
jgi:hypothetical protein